MGLNSGTTSIKFGNSFRPLAGQSFESPYDSEGIVAAGVAVTVVGLGVGLSSEHPFCHRHFSVEFVQVPGTELSMYPLLATGFAFLVFAARPPCHANSIPQRLVRLPAPRALRLGGKAYG